MGKKIRKKCPVCGDDQLKSERVGQKAVQFCSWCSWRSDQKGA